MAGSSQQLVNAHYQQWRELKQRAADMLRANPVILAVAGGKSVNKKQYQQADDILQQWRKLKADIEAIERQSAAELKTWRAAAIAELKEQREQSKPARQIKLFGRMMTRAQLLRHELSLRFWAGVRYIANGENNVSLATIRATFSDNGRYAFTSWPNLRKQINKAIERGYMHYSKDKTRLYFASERRVALQVLGLPAVGGWALSISIEELTGDFVNNRALFYSAFHGSRGDGFNNPISRQSIKRETGRGKRTQRKYEKLAKVTTARNWEYVGQGILEKIERVKPKKVNGEHMLVSDLPNSYAANLATVKRGRRWLNWRITYLCKKFSDNGHYPSVIPMGSCDDKVKQKRYFTRPPKVSADTARFYPLIESSRVWARVS